MLLFIVSFLILYSIDISENLVKVPNIIGCIYDYACHILSSNELEIL